MRHVHPLLFACLLLALGACAGDGAERIGAIEGVVIEVEPGSLRFPATPVGEIATREIAVRHAGDEGILTLDPARLVDDAPEFTVEGPTPRDLSPGEQARVRVSYAPVDDRPDQVVLLLGHDSPLSTDPVQVPITTGAPNEALVALPFELDFGSVRAGEDVPLDVRLLNRGSRVVTLETVALHRFSSPDFRLLTDRADLGLPVAIAPDEWLDVRVAYRPAGGDAVDVGMLQAIAPDRTLEATVHVRGQELAPDLSVSPLALDFGEVFLHEVAEATITLANGGDVPLTLGAITIRDAVVPWLALIDAPAPGATIEPGEQARFALRFAPLGSFEPTTSLLARVRVASNDPDSPYVHVEVQGRVRVPRLVATPQPLEFGRVAPGDTRERDLLLVNNSRPRVDVSVHALSLTSPTGEFELADHSPVPPFTVAAGQAVVLPVRFTNGGGEADEVVEAILLVRDDQDDEPDARVELRAERADGPRCRPEISPPRLDFGVVRGGQTPTLALRVDNRGSSPCDLAAWEVEDCGPQVVGSCAPLAQGQASFERAAGGPQVGARLEPGQSWLLPLRLSPSPALADAPGLHPVEGLSMTRWDDPLGGGPTLAVPAEAAPNLEGLVGRGCLVVAPDQVLLGDVRVGCSSPLGAVHAHNTCDEPVTVTAIDLVDPGGEFKLVNLPFLPATLTREVQMNLRLVAYAPRDLGPDAASVRIHTDEPGQPCYTVPAGGEGVLDAHVRETFTQTGGRDVDILFVVDNSGSMADNQANLAANFGTLVGLATQWDTRYQVGVVTTDMSPWGPQGLLEGDPPWVTPDDWQRFVELVQVGVNGSGAEMGLAAMEAALSWPMAADTGYPCQSDAACEPPLACVRGACGGPNRGFLRPDAVLHVVFVSDEDDQSPGTPAYFLDVLLGLKGPGNEQLVQAHAVVGLEDAQPGTATICSYERGQRYIDLALATGGGVTDLCAADWAGKLEALGQAIFGLVHEFPLVRPPAPDTLTVTIDGAACEGAWRYEPAGDLLIFDEDDPCMPRHGDEIVVEYEAMCYRY